MTENVRGFGPYDHICWVFDEPREFHRHALEFMTDGLTRGLRVCYFTSNDTTTPWDDLRALDEANRARQGAVQVQYLGDVYPTGTVIEPVSQVQAYAAATEDALAAGFVGLRVVGEGTSLVRTPEQLDAFVRYEHLIDRYMTDQPLSALCAYNRVELGEQTIAQVASLHPAVNDAAVPFRLHACDHAAAALGGELDLTSLDLLLTALRRADLMPTDGKLVVDATELAFIDYRSLLALTEYARRRNATAVLQTSLPSPAQMVKILDLTGIQVEMVT
ncbi:MAG: MEDS domain-containing protein [Pseudonocardiales bacterium]